ncbi:MAG: signal peptidase I [Victivallales bacterium]|nr:signal peptidase I [Victivallales bacterium]
MNHRYLLSLFWYFVWFVALPGVIAWQAVEIFVRVRLFGFFEEFEFWHVLLLYALLAFLMYSIRDKLPFWKVKDKDHPFRTRRRLRDAKRLLQSVEKILAKNGKAVSKKGRAELEVAMSSLKKAIASGENDRLVEAMTGLGEKVDRHLAFAKKSASREYIESIGIAVLVAVLLRLFVVEAFKIPSESMVPTLMVGDHIFVSKYRYGLSLPFVHQRLVRFSDPKHGEVIVFIKPKSELSLPVEFEGDESDMAGTDFIKRIVGLPGDVVEMKRDILFINNKEIPRCLVGTSSYRTRLPFENKWRDGKAELWIEKHGEFQYTIAESLSGHKDSFGPITVPPDRVFVLGDNRDNSNDSRYWGTVPFDNIKGRAMFIWWSNRRPHGFQWDRVGTMIMGAPELTEVQQDKLAACPNMR